MSYLNKIPALLNGRDDGLNTYRKIKRRDRKYRDFERQNKTARLTMEIGSIPNVLLMDIINT